MPEESESNSSIRFVRVVLPWLLAAGMLVLYLLTLNHWVSPESLGLIANVSGLNYRAESVWAGHLPGHLAVPLAAGGLDSPALNLFAAGCAALSLAWLARAVALLPHDQTDAQRLRLRGERAVIGDPHRVAAAGAGGAGLRFATDVLGACHRGNGRDVQPVAVCLAGPLPAGIANGWEHRRDCRASHWCTAWR